MKPNQRPKPARPGTRPPNYAARSVQYRLLMHVGALMVVVLLMVEAAKPKNWEWLWHGERIAALQNDSTPTAPNDIALPGDPNFQPPPLDRDQSQRSFSPDSFRSPQALSSTKKLPESRDLKRLPPSWFADVRDDTYFRSEESAAWFGVLDTWQHHSESADAQEIAQVGYTQLFRQMPEYRGKLVRIEGSIRRIRRLEAPKNSSGIETYWQSIWNLKGSRNSPVIVYSLEVPTGLSPALEMHESGSATAIGFKRWVYPAAAGPMIAPVLLAKTIEWRPKATSSEPSNRQIATTYWPWFVAISVFAASIVVWRVYVTTTWKPTRGQTGSDSMERLDASLKNVDLPTIGDHLRGLATDDPPQTSDE